MWNPIHSLTFISRSEVCTHANDKRKVVVFIYTTINPVRLYTRLRKTKFVAVHATKAYSGNVS